MIQFAKHRKARKAAGLIGCEMPVIVELEHSSLRIAQDHKCWICGEDMLHPGDAGFANSPRGRSIDHILPTATRKALAHYVPMPLDYRQEIGRNNVLYACKQCNSSRGCTPLTHEQALRIRYIMIAATAFELARYVDESRYWREDEYYKDQ